MATEVDQANRAAWGSSRVVDLLVEREGFMSEGERRVMERVVTEARGQPILDVGVGGGRTTAFLRSVSPDYVGVDYLQELVAGARSRYPDARFEHMDARDLSAFADETFALVVFSLNGIDGVPHADRRKILWEFHRVLRPGGLCAYSTHNLDYRLAGRRPWHSDWRAILRHPWRALRYAVRLPKMTWRRRRLNSATDRGAGWATIATLAYGFPVVWHHVTLAESLRELREVGFTGEVEIYSSSGFGTTITANSSPESAAVGELDTSGWPVIHLVARKP